jgi:hypothetical protein
MDSWTVQRRITILCREELGARDAVVQQPGAAALQFKTEELALSVVVLLVEEVWREEVVVVLQ